MTQIAVVGPGSVGVFFAAHLAANGHDVLACARRPFSEYVIKSNTHELRHSARVITEVSAIPATHQGGCDWVFLCVKAQQTEAAAQWLEHLCTKRTKVVVVQNGIEHERCRPWVNGAQIIPSAVYCGAQLQAPGVVHHVTGSHLEVSHDPSGVALAALFEGSAAEIHLVDELAEAQWRKLGLNVVANGLTALTNRPISVIGDAAVLPIARQLLQECWQVGQAAGVPVDPTEAAAAIDKVVSRKIDGIT